MLCVTVRRESYAYGLDFFSLSSYHVYLILER